MTTNAAPVLTLWTCSTCSATVTDRGRRLMGPLCWLCGGRLVRDLEPTKREGGRNE